MDPANVKELLEKANKYLKDPDAIIDPYDMTFVWVSEERTKKFSNDLVGERVASTSEDAHGIQDFGKMSMEATTPDYKVREKEIILHVGPNEKRKALINYVVIEFGGQPYLVTKVIRLED